VGFNLYTIGSQQSMHVLHTVNLIPNLFSNGSKSSIGDIVLSLALLYTCSPASPLAGVLGPRSHEATRDHPNYCTCTDIEHPPFSTLFLPVLPCF
jgi:hypothetical protein